jgi:hypothetical protein
VLSQKGVFRMNEPIAWLDGLIALIVFPVGLILIAYLFRKDSKEA